MNLRDGASSLGWRGSAARRCRRVSLFSLFILVLLLAPGRPVRSGHAAPISGAKGRLEAPAGESSSPAKPSFTGLAGARQAYFADSWYPGEKAVTMVEVQRMLRAGASAPSLKGKPLALIVPHAGWEFSGAAAAAAFRTLHSGDYRRVVIIAPSHRHSLRGFASDDHSAYHTPLGEIPICADALSSLAAKKLVQKIAGVTDGEHAAEIELPFLQETLGAFCLVPIMAGEAGPAEQKALAGALAGLNDGQTLFVVSSDFTHYGESYGYAPFGGSVKAARAQIGDQNRRAIGFLERIDPAGFRSFIDETQDTICGRVGIGVLLELLRIAEPKARPVLMGYYTSADIPERGGDTSVSYVAFAYSREEAAGSPLLAPPSYTPVSPDAPPLGAEAGDRLVRLARAALRTQLAGTDDLRRELGQFPKGSEFERLQATFVTLNRTDPAEIASMGKLRGCIGQVWPTYPLYTAVVHAAVDAALNDSRFNPVTAHELARIEVEVTALSPPKPVPSWRDIKLGTHGIVMQKNGRRALFLPQVPGEQGWDIEQTLGALSRKAGLPLDAWREGAAFAVFTGEVFEERSNEKPTGEHKARPKGKD